MVSQVFARDIFDKEVEKTNIQQYYLDQDSPDVLNASGDGLRFDLGNSITIKDIGPVNITAVDNVGDSRTDFTASVDCEVSTTGNFMVNAVDRHCKIVVVKATGNEYIYGAGNAYTDGPSHFAGSFKLLAGEYFYFGTSVSNRTPSSGPFATSTANTHNIFTFVATSIGKQKISDI